MIVLIPSSQLEYPMSVNCRKFVAMPMEHFWLVYRFPWGFGKSPIIYNKYYFDLKISY